MFDLLAHVAEFAIAVVIFAIIAVAIKLMSFSATKQLEKNGVESYRNGNWSGEGGGSFFGSSSYDCDGGDGGGD